jgi:hypothetical protein
MRKNWLGTLTVSLALVAVPSVCAGSTLYGIEFGTGTGFYGVNQSTGALSLVGNTGNNTIGDLASDLVSTIWAPDFAKDALLTIDPATGAVGSTTPIRDATGAPVSIVSLAWDPLTKVLYGNTAVGFGTLADVLYKINAGTGLATKIGSGIGINQVYALGFDNKGTLYGISHDSNQLITIDTGTGAGSAVAFVSLGVAFDLAFRPEDNKMFVAESLPDASLYTMDPVTGATTLIGPYGSPVNDVGLAFLTAPEPGTFALLIEGLGLLCCCAPRRMRKMTWRLISRA